MKNYYKLLLLTIIVSLSTISANAEIRLDKNDQSTILDTTKFGKQIYYDSKEAIKYLVNGGDSALQYAGNLLTQASPNVWAILVDQQKVKSTAYLIAFLLYLGLVYYYKEVITRIYVKVSSSEEFLTWKQSEVIFAVVGGVLIISLGYFNVVHFNSMLTGFLNPRYGALLELVETGNAVLKTVN